jgi:hypothetical protein
VGIRVFEAGRGQNKNGAWDIAKDCEANVKRSYNVEE